MQLPTGLFMLCGSSYSIAVLAAPDLFYGETHRACGGVKMWEHGVGPTGSPLTGTAMETFTWSFPKVYGTSRVRYVAMGARS